MGIDKFFACLSEPWFGILQKPSDSCLEVLYEDMMLLSVAMECLYQQLQSKELWDLFICVEMKLTPLLAALELTSLSVATHTLMQFSEILKVRRLSCNTQTSSYAVLFSYKTVFSFSFLNLLYTGRLFHCYMLDKSICHFRGDGSILLLLFYFD